MEKAFNSHLEGSPDSAEEYDYRYRMKIDNSQILMNSKRMYSVKDETSVSVRIWSNPPQSVTSDTVSISQAAKTSLENSSSNLDSGVLDPVSELETSLEKLIAELLSGRKIRIVSLDEVQGSDHGMEDVRQGQGPDAQSPENNPQGWGLEIKSEEVHQENENVSFFAQGIIKTSEGKEVGFSLRLDMNREYMEKNNLTVRAGDALSDPLVINLSGAPAGLSEKKFAFDLNADGKDEQLSALRPGSGFLVIDVNGDGIINDGSELFGPRTGNGFRELESIDSDNNKWIDENDEAYKKLGIMTFDEKGEQSIKSLQEVGVGAIYTPYSSTQFDLRRQDTNALLGIIKGSGIYISVQGQAGTVQQVDFVT